MVYDVDRAQIIPGGVWSQEGMTINSVVCATRLLELIAGAQNVGLSELARRAAMPKSSVQRYLLTLEDAGWIKNSDGAWEISSRVGEIFAQEKGGQNLREVALPFLNKLQLDTTETIHLSAPRGRSMLLIERVDTSHPLRAFLPVGGMSEMHTCASGVAYLSASHEAVIREYAEGAFRKVTQNTIDGASALDDAINEVKRRGFAINDQGLNEGICSVGCPLLGVTGSPVGAVSVSGPKVRMDEKAMERYGEMLVSAARQISEAWSVAS